MKISPRRAEWGTHMSVTNTHFGAEKISRMLSGRKAVSFLGIGGITMSSMAHITKTMGYRVGGSDRTLSPLTERLAKEGIEIFCGHDASHLDGYDALVYTVAVRDDTPELVRARAEGLPVISRADYLGYLMRGYTHRVGLAGMHGKSTTTSLTTEIFLAAGADPTVISGAELSSIDGAYRVGGRENFIFEACEYMDSFLDFYPTVAAVLNIEMDHVDYFKSMAQIKHSFRAYIDKTVGCGCAVLNADDDNVCDMAEGFGGSVLTFGIRRAADVTAKNITYDRGRASFDLCHGSMKKNVTLAVCGEHNVYNALAAAACAILCGIPSGAIVTGLGNFRGAKRRLEFKGKLGGADVYDDYAHHPTELTATLKAAMAMPFRQVWAVFQPFTFSRTAMLLDEFAEALSIPDHAVLTDIMGSREKNTYNIFTRQLGEKIPDAVWFPQDERNPETTDERKYANFAQVTEYICDHAQPGDLVITLGCGDINKVNKMILEELERRQAAK